MKRKFRFLSIAVVLATVFTFASSVRPTAASCVILSVEKNPPGLQINFLALANHTYSVSITDLNPDQVFGPYPVDTPKSVLIGSNRTATVTDLNSECAGSITTFNPGDKRLDGKPGDRLVVYCNPKAIRGNIEVFVIAPGGIGTSLGKIPLADLANGQISKDVGVNGTLLAGTNDDDVSFVALQGGKYNATGTGDWIKAFTC